MRISDWSSDVCSSDLYLHTKYDEGSPGFPKGNAFAQAPKHTVNLSANYTRDLGEAGELAASAGYTYQSRSEEHTSELQSLMRISYAVFCLKKKNNLTHMTNHTSNTPIISIQ